MSSGASKAEMVNLRGVLVYPGFLAPETQAKMVGELRRVAQSAPFFRPETRRGQKMSVRMTSAGRFGWVSDRAKGYRYEPRHPSGAPWPDIPETVLQTWHSLTQATRPPDSCLINYYDDTARMGLHQDRDEADFSWPVLSISLGDEALFRVGNTIKGGKTESLWLRSGDVAVLGGEARLAFHGIDRIRPGTSTLLEKGGRLNVTLRMVE